MPILNAHCVIVNVHNQQICHKIYKLLYTMKSVQNRPKRTGKLFKLELISFLTYKLQSVIKDISKHLIFTILGPSLDSFVRDEKGLNSVFSYYFKLFNKKYTFIFYKMFYEGIVYKRYIRIT